MKVTALLNTALQRWLASLGIKAIRITTDKVRGIDPMLDLRSLLGDNQAPLIFDIGANEGETVEDFLHHFPAARIVAFEPFTACFESLRKRFAGRPNVQIEKLALGAVAGAGQLNVFSGSNMNSLLTLDGTPENVLKDSFSQAGTTPVAVDTLDGFCAARGIQRVDVLKIDTQGFDLEVLKGAVSLLSARKIIAVVIEVNFIPMYRKQARFVELHEFLSNCGYRLVDFYNQHRHAGYTMWCDACYVVAPEFGAV